MAFDPAEAALLDPLRVAFLLGFEPVPGRKAEDRNLCFGRGMIAFLMLILAEDGCIPVDNPTGQFELAMIDRSKSLEYSGRGAALMKWAGAMKFCVLIIVFLNVVVAPWGMAQSTSALAVLAAIPLVLLKILGFILILVAIESSLAKLRLFRITEFLGAAFVICVVAMITRLSQI